MTEKIKDDARARIAEFLPGALERAIASYRMLTRNCGPVDAEGKRDENPLEVKRYHEACKAAIGHMQYLLKLAEILDLPDAAPEGVDQEKLTEMIENARQEVAAYEKGDE